MPSLLRSPMNIVGRPKYWLARHFADERTRFRFAVSTGFVLAAVSFLVVGADTRFGSARSLLGLFGLPEGGVEAPRYFYGQQPAQPRRARRQPTSARESKGGMHLVSGQAMSLARKSLCVRLCDGFAFPVGDYHGDADRPAHEAACRSDCPGARTALYVLPAGADSPAMATNTRTGRSYSQMAEAFRYTTYVDEACACHPPGGGGIRSLLRDFTLRRGDAVMTSTGLQVFHGGAGYPFKRRDFVALGKSRDIRRADRGTLQAIERASLAAPNLAPATVAAAPPAPKKPAAVSRNATRGLQHQAQS